MKTIDVDKDYIGTDELEVEFYCCPCGFLRVPRAKRKTDPDDRYLLTAKYCPGCGEEVHWVVYR